MTQDDKYWILLSRYIAEGLPDDQTEELFRWISEDPERQTVLEQAQSAWDRSKDYQEIHANDFDTDAAWMKVRSKMQEDQQENLTLSSQLINSESVSQAAVKSAGLTSEELISERTTPAPVKSGRVFQLRWLSVAASLLLFCALGWYTYTSYDQNRTVVVANKLDKTQEVVLPDGSTVWLNKGGELSYKKGLAKLSKREVSLVGEAFFEVEHNAQKPFIVYTGVIETQVLGTSFNVLSDGSGSVSVAVVSGKVSFREASKEGLLLLPGEEGNYTPTEGVRKRMFSNTNFLYWKHRYLSFENEKLGIVLQTLETAYNVKFKLDDQDLLNQEITTSFKSASIEDVILLLENLLDLNIIKSGDAYIVVK